MDIIKIESLDLEAQGVAHREDGKVVFVEGALPFEWVSAQVNRRKNNFEQATLTHIHRESNQRVRPKCRYFGLHQGACGGCKMQHLEVSAQVAVKARTLEDNLWHIGKVRADNILAPMQGPDWGYRFRARLSVRYVRKKETVLIGFHERKSRYLTDMESCQILPPHVSDLLMPLRALLASMDARETCPQIELACGQVASGFITALVLRHLEPLSEGDKERLRAFALEHARIGLEWWLQAKGPDTVQLLSPDLGSQLAYTLPEFGVEMPFKPTDFTQVNPYINQVLVSKALRYLGVQAHERVIDWFCGLGNFTLPLATQAREVLGVEGSSALVERATQNAAMNAERSKSRGELPVRAKIDFVARNLFDMTPAALAADASVERWLIDPPREGAFALVQALAALMREPEYEALRVNWTAPKRIVYVSCNPATLARDAEVLVHQAGYRCTHAGVINMFPHTAHVESLAVFDLVA